LVKTLDTNERSAARRSKEISHPLKQFALYWFLGILSRKKAELASNRNRKTLQIYKADSAHTKVVARTTESGEGAPSDDANWQKLC